MSLQFSAASLHFLKKSPSDILLQLNKQGDIAVIVSDTEEKKTCMQQKMK